MQYFKHAVSLWHFILIPSKALPLDSFLQGSAHSQSKFPKAIETWEKVFKFVITFYEIQQFLSAPAQKLLGFHSITS